MKFYDAEKLFVGSVGYCGVEYKNGDEYPHFIESQIAITKLNTSSPGHYYIDVLSEKKYVNFHSNCCPGDDCILVPKSLALFIRQMYSSTQQSEIINSLAKEVLKGQKISDNEIKELVVFLNSVHKKKKSSKDNIETKNKNENKKLDQNNIITSYSTILTKKNFKVEPAIGRDNEVNELIITLAQDKKNPILIGPSGSGKTTIVDELAYRIKKGDVPNFLKKRKIIEIDLASLLSGTKYSGTLEEKITNLINLSIKNNAIVFIDEIHTIYGAGTHDKSDYDIASMIKQAIDRKGLKIIGTTTTEEYEKYFCNDALKRRFEKILVEEPNNVMLYKIIYKVFNDYSHNNNIKLLDNLDNIIYSLIELTDFKHRSYNDKICNPDLVIGIIDKSFAIAKVNNQTELTTENIIYGINSCNRIYDSCKENTISNLDKKYKQKQKIIELKKGR